MKNKPDPALVGGSYLFNEIKKRTPKSRETIPLRNILHFTDFISEFSAVAKKILEIVLSVVSTCVAEPDKELQHDAAPAPTNLTLPLAFT
jgi:hypothetical protein